MEHGNHLHTHVHKTQTYWPSQANNKLIWAILVLRGGTKQRDQTGRGGIFPEMRCASPPCYFLAPVALAFWTCGVDIITTVSGADLWSSALSNGRVLRKKKKKMGRGKKNVAATTIDTRPCVLPSMHNNSVVWLGFHGYNPSSPHSQKTSPPTKKKHKSLLSDVVCRSNYAPDRKLVRCSIIPRVKRAEINPDLGKCASLPPIRSIIGVLSVTPGCRNWLAAIKTHDRVGAETRWMGNNQHFDIKSSAMTTQSAGASNGLHASLRRFPVGCFSSPAVFSEAKALNRLIGQIRLYEWFPCRMFTCHCADT